MYPLSIIFLCFYLLTACSSTTKTHNAATTAADVAALTATAITGNYIGPIPKTNPVSYDFVKHQLEIKGSILAPNNKFINFKKYKIEIYLKSNLISTLEPDENGNFEGTIKSTKGLHNVKLLYKNKSEIIDSAEVNSNENQDRFTVILKANR